MIKATFDSSRACKYVLRFVWFKLLLIFTVFGRIILYSDTIAWHKLSWREQMIGLNEGALVAPSISIDLDIAFLKNLLEKISFS